MANPFAEAEKSKAVAPNKRKDPEEEKIKSKEKEDISDIEEKASGSKTSANSKKTTNKPNAFFDNINVKQKREAKSVGYYLDKRVIDALENKAKELGTNPSSLLNDILLNVFSIN